MSPSTPSLPHQLEADDSNSRLLWHYLRCYRELSPFLFDIRYVCLGKSWEKSPKFLDHNEECRYLGPLLSFIMTASTYLVSAGDFWPFQIPGKRRSHILTKCVLPSNSAKHSNGAQWLWGDWHRHAGGSGGKTGFVRSGFIGMIRTGFQQGVWLPRDRKVSAEEQKLGKPEQPRAVGNSMIPVCPGFFLSDGSHQPHSDWFHLQSSPGSLRGWGLVANLWHSLILSRPCLLV